MMQDLIGKKFGKLVVLEQIARPKNLKQRGRYFVCLCDCGKTKIIHARSLTSRRTSSCGCANKHMSLDGRRFGKLLVIKRVSAPEHIKNRQKPYYLCKCDCGNQSAICSESLKSNLTTSCGCNNNPNPNLIGKVFGKLTVISKGEVKIHPNGKKSGTHICVCECGDTKVINSRDLRRGKITSCGCTIRHTSENELILASAKIVFNSKYKDGDLLFEHFFDLVQNNCHYCGGEPSNKFSAFTRSCNTDFAKKHGYFIYNGLDRVNNNLPHNKNNVVPCCIICNRMKSNHEVEYFKLHIKKIHKFLDLDKCS